MTKLMIGFAIALSAAACGGGSNSKGNEALAKTEDFSKRMCECKDKACGDKVNDDFTKWGQEIAKTADAKTTEKPDAELTKKLTAAATKYSECFTKLATPPVEDKKEPAPTPTEDKKEPAPTEDKKEPAVDPKQDAPK